MLSEANVPLIQVQNIIKGSQSYYGGEVTRSLKIVKAGCSRKFRQSVFQVFIMGGLKKSKPYCRLIPIILDDP